MKTIITLIMCFYFACSIGCGNTINVPEKVSIEVDHAATPTPSPSKKAPAISMDKIHYWELVTTGGTPGARINVSMIVYYDMEGNKAQPGTYYWRHAVSGSTHTFNLDNEGNHIADQTGGSGTARVDEIGSDCTITLYKDHVAVETVNIKSGEKYEFQVYE